jgi:hypothetical protein
MNGENEFLNFLRFSHEYPVPTFEVGETLDLLHPQKVRTLHKALKRYRRGIFF